MRKCSNLNKITVSSSTYEGGDVLADHRYPLAVAAPPYLLGGGSYPPATCVVFLGGGVWVSPNGAPPPGSKTRPPLEITSFSFFSRVVY